MSGVVHILHPHILHPHLCYGGKEGSLNGDEGGCWPMMLSPKSKFLGF